MMMIFVFHLYIYKLLINRPCGRYEVVAIVQAGFQANARTGNAQTGFQAVDLASRQTPELFSQQTSELASRGMSELASEKALQLFPSERLSWL